MLNYRQRTALCMSAILGCFAFIALKKGALSGVLFLMFVATATATIYRFILQRNITRMEKEKSRLDISSSQNQGQAGYQFGLRAAALSIEIKNKENALSALNDLLPFLGLAGGLLGFLARLIG